MKNMQKMVFLFAMVISNNVDGQLWKEYVDSAKILRQQSKYADAILYFKKSLNELKKDSLNTITYGLLLDNLGNAYSNMAQNDNAEAIFTEAKEVWQKMGNQPENLAWAYNSLAILYRNMHQYPKAESHHLEAKKTLEKTYDSIALEKNSTYANTCDNLGILYQITSDYSLAEPLLLKARAIREIVDGKGSNNYAISCDNLGIFYSSISKYNLGESYMIEGKNAWEKFFKSKESQSYATSCNNLGFLYKKTGQYKKAETLYHESRKIREKILPENHPQLARSFENLGFLYIEMGMYENAEDLLLKAKNIIDRTNDNPDNPRNASILSAMGTLYRHMGQFEKAEIFYVQVKEIMEKVFDKKPLNYVTSYNNLATLYESTGQYAKAEALYLAAKKISEGEPSGKQNAMYALSCSNLGSVYAYMGEYAKAKLYAAEAMEIWGKVVGKEHLTYAQICNTLGFSLANLGDYKEAELLYMESKDIRQKIVGTVHTDYIQSCLALANLYWMQNKPKEAYNYYSDAFNFQKTQNSIFFAFTNEFEKHSYIKTYEYIEKHIQSFNLTSSTSEKQDFVYQLAISKRNLVLSSVQQLRQAILTSTDTNFVKLSNKWFDLKEQLSFWLSKPIQERKGMDGELVDKANNLEKELMRLSDNFKKQQKQQEITWKDIQNSLHEGEAAIEFSEFQYYNGRKYTDSVYYIALILQKDKPYPEMIKLFERRQLDSLLKYKNTSASQHYLTSLYSKPQINELNSLYNIIWKPIEEKLTGIKNIYLAPAGLLYKISFAALPVSKTEVLSDRYTLVQLNTTSSIVNNFAKNVSVTDKINIYGGVQYNADSNSIRNAALKYSANDVATRSLPDDLPRDGVGEFYYLTGSEKEVAEIRKLATQNNYSVTVSDGVLATEESFKALTGKNSPAILHIATHGFFFPDPKNEKKDDRMGGAIVFKQSNNPLIRSGLALAGANNAWKGKPVAGVEDGILTSFEVSNMYLPNTKLAVLSACETGLGDIQGSEGVYGLQRAFKIAGVENLIMSLWKVDDAATSEFMQEFYKGLFAKRTIQDAFYNAQRVMKNKYRSDPYKWAAWVLIR